MAAGPYSQRAAKPIFWKIAAILNSPLQFRLSWDEAWMLMALIVGRLTHCVRYKVGAVLVSKNRVMATGYNGPVMGDDHCDEVGCEKDIHRRCRGSHAERNAIDHSPYTTSETKGAILYVTVSPCLDCAKDIVNSGIETVVFLNVYDRKEGAEAIQFLLKNHVWVYKLVPFVGRRKITAVSPEARAPKKAKSLPPKKAAKKALPAKKFGKNTRPKKAGKKPRTTGKTKK